MPNLRYFIFSLLLLVQNLTALCSQRGAYTLSSAFQYNRRRSLAIIHSSAKRRNRLYFLSPTFFQFYNFRKYFTIHKPWEEITMSGGHHFATGSSKPQLPDDGVLRLYSMRFCPYAHRVHLVLDAKKVPYHPVFINLTDKPEWLTDFSPLGKVPALQLVSEKGGPALIESLVIAEYLDEKYPEPRLLPKDPLQKAKDKILVERFNAVVAPMYKIFVNPEVSPGTITDVSNGLDTFEKELRQRGTKFFGGETPGFLDYMIWPWCERSAMIKVLLSDKYEMDKERFEKLLQWRDHMVEDEAVKCFYLDGETHAKFMKTRREGKPNYDMLV